MNNPMRWKQRFENFTNAYQKLIMVVEYKNLKSDEIAKMALIQAFEFTFELVWKTLKDYMEEEGFEVNSPKAVLRQAYQANYISNGDVWMEALKKRNNTVHNYDASLMEETVNFIIDDFYPALKEWYLAFSERR
ncbi:MAG TPA: nucleotidyltransferase substrate binding protein [Methylomusa anaerophila]|uniref:Nucleotidyltransferase substrate binding protein like protein n=1 Tax=Methylomusa anaerophila TaxID=1930071 RepID=A0A348AG19_9FIRM|nr:nucleotidyltransferase substrate binding protein [Methylomusa anaerophila]BBB90017.1 nucleotidyltransferase substrate binding protein like protein [Methylomusa anaerophila]HML88254.1 nucleotidyltransferase substrate binding protein [Methylomusa anaerophila]